MMLEDNSLRELQKLSQNIVDELAKANKVPTIPVKFVDRIDGLDNLGGIFRRDEYTIEITKNVDALAIVHEFTHYLLKLLDESNDIEEHITQWTVVGYQTELNSLTKPSKIKTHLLNYQKRIEELQKEKVE